MLKKIFFSLLAICNFLFSFSQENKIIDHIVAVVGTKIITLSEIESQYMQYQARGYHQNADMKCVIFEELLFQRLLLNQAELDSLQISDKQVDKELEARVSSIVEQMGGQQKVEEYFNKTLIEIKEDLRDAIHDQLLAQKMQGEITKEVKSLPSDVQIFFNSIPKDSLPTIESEVEMAQIVKYPEVLDEMKKITKQRLNEYRERILKSTNPDVEFAGLARLYSEDKESAKNGGNLGFIGRGELVPEFAAVAFNLKIGEVSNIVETEFGFHIIKVLEKRGEQSSISHILLSPPVASEQKIKSKNYLDSLATVLRTKKDTLTFEETAMFYSEDKNTRNNGGLIVNPQTGSTRFTINQLDAATNFTLKTMNIGEISAPFETKDEKGKVCYKIIWLKSRTKEHIANLKDDYQKIMEFSLRKKKQDAINKWILEKQKTTYIHIDNSYKNCSFNFKGWLK